MKVLLFMLVVFCFSSCAYKPRLLINPTNHINKTHCYLLAEKVQNRQEIYYKIKEELAKYPNEKELYFYYDLQQFIDLNVANCNDNYIIIEEIATEELFFSDTGSNKYGIHLLVKISFMENNSKIATKKFNVEIIGEFHSTLTLFKKKIDRIMVSLLRSAFLDLDKQISTVSKNL